MTLDKADKASSSLFVSTCSEEQATYLRMQMEICRKSGAFLQQIKTWNETKPPR